jgi:hypothetical protein
MLRFTQHDNPATVMLNAVKHPSGDNPAKTMSAKVKVRKDASFYSA